MTALENKRYCGCAEMHIVNEKGDRVHVPIIETPLGSHDCGYVHKRNALIPEALKIAAKKVPHFEDIDCAMSDKIKFTQVFSKEMDRLAKPLFQ